MLVLGFVSLAVGSRYFSVGELIRAIDHQDGEAWLYLISYRVPRTILALLAGAALGIAGCLVQAITRNPIAGPGILGVNSGASLSVMLAVQAGVIYPLTQVGIAMAGAAIIATIVLAIGLRQGGHDPVRLILIGTAIGAALEAVTAGITLTKPNSQEQFRQWAIGSVADRGASMLPVMAIALAVGLAASLAISRSLDALSLGDDVAHGLGVQKHRVVLLSGIAVTILCGTATAAAGPIVFVGLLVPHLARALVGISFRPVLPMCALVGGGLMLCADILGRVVSPGTEIPSGAMSAIIGAPLFFVIVRRSKVVTL